MKISPKHLVGGMLIGLILIFAALFSLPDGKLHLVFCDVGQGDAIYIRGAGGEDILIDGGPNEKVLSCLGNHMPFYDRTIEMVILSHPQADHLNGLISVLERYNVNYFVSSGIEGETQGSKRLKNLLKDKKIRQNYLGAGGKISLDEIGIKGLWPPKDFLGSAANSSTVRGVLSATSKVSLGGLALDLNNLSLVLKLSYGNFDALLTGDAGQDVQDRVVDVEPVEVLKVPHHGSKTALLSSFLEAIDPQLAVISVGKNSYGHPTPELLKLLSDRAIKTLRTDKDGEIEIVSDGKSWGLTD